MGGTRALGGYNGSLTFDEYHQRFMGHERVAELGVVAELVEPTGRFPLLVARTEGSRQLVVTAGFHGDETAGPLTLLEHLPDLVAYARARGVGLTVYPCVNPSGFEACTRYNASGELPNNDFLRYQLPSGDWVGELTSSQAFERFELYRGGPKETQALREALEQLPPPDAALDIHQDPWTPGALSYAYTFGPREAYLPMVEETDALVPVARRSEVDDDVHTDGDGLIQLHDGSITDWYFRLGVPYTAALETTTATDMALCHQVNLTWLRGFVDLAAGRAPVPGGRPSR